MRNLRYSIFDLSIFFYYRSVNRLGSLLVDYEIIGVKAQSKKIKFEVGVANSMLKILKGEHIFKILKQEARVIEVIIKDNNGSSFSEQSKFNPTNIFK